MKTEPDTGSSDLQKSSLFSGYIIHSL